MFHRSRSKAELGVKFNACQNVNLIWCLPECFDDLVVTT